MSLHFFDRKCVKSFRKIKKGVMGSEGAIGAEEDEGAAIYLMFDG